MGNKKVIENNANTNENVEAVENENGMDTKSLEEQFEKLNEIIDRLEDPAVSLEESFQAYEAGMRLLKSCNDKIDRVEKRVLVLNSEGGLDEF